MGIFEIRLMDFFGIAVVTVWSIVFSRESGSTKSYKLLFTLSPTQTCSTYIFICREADVHFFPAATLLITQMELDPSAADLQGWLRAPAARLCQPFGEGTGLTSGGLTFSIRHMIQKHKSGVGCYEKMNVPGKNSVNAVLWNVVTLSD